MSLKSYCEKSGKLYLLEQWDREKNLPFSPETVGHASMRRVWWRCEKGHLWQTQLHSRTAGSTGCPRCNEERLERKRAQKQAAQARCKEEETVKPGHEKNSAGKPKT